MSILKPKADPSVDDVLHGLIASDQRQVEAADARRATLGEQIAAMVKDQEDARHNCQLGYLEECVRADALTAPLAALRQEDAALAETIAPVRTRLAENEKMLTRKQEIARRREIAELEGTADRHAGDIDLHASRLGASIRALRAVNRAIADAEGTDVARKLLGDATLFSLMSSLDKHLRTEAAPADGGIAGLAFLQSGQVGMGADKGYTRSVKDRHAAVLARSVRYYPTREEAAAARLLADPAGATLHVVRDPEAGVWELREGQRRGGPPPAPEPEAEPGAKTIRDHLRERVG